MTQIVKIRLKYNKQIMLKLGAHLSTSGGITKPLENIVSIGGNCLQIFSSSPMMWVNSKLSEEDIQQFVSLKKELYIDPIYFHACYLINLADTDKIGEKSIKSLVFELNLAQKLGIKGSIVHTGSFKDGKVLTKDYAEIKGSLAYKALISNINSVISETPKDTFIILENAGNRKIGRTINQLANILEDVNNDRLKVCLDTCHLHAAGYDLKNPELFEAFLDEFDSLIGLERLEVMHLNDSRDEFGSLRDRHQNIGEGNVGIEVFKNLLNNKKTKHLPFIIETPGFDEKGPDKQNLNILKGLIK